MKDWGLQMVACTGSRAHLRNLTAVTGSLRGLNASFPSEQAFYKKFGLQYTESELREGFDEVERAANNALPTLVTASDIRGELHAHSTSSDGSDSIEDMAEAARERGYEYIGISDHSQSLKIARGVSVEASSSSAAGASDDDLVFRMWVISC
jgi:DNA polymerase (family 10)